jgi:hypothetical protein
MTQLVSPVEAAPVRTATLWRWGGGLALAHVIVLFAGFSQEVSVEHGTPLSQLMQKYQGADLTRVFAGGYVESMAFVVLVPALVVLARLFSGRTETGQLAARTFLGFGLVYAAATLAVGMVPGAAALYAAQHGADVRLVATVNDIRNYGFVLQVAISLAMTLALGVAARAERIFVRWVGWGGIALGAVGILATPFVHNGLSMLQLIWWVGLAVLCLRGGPKSA